MRKYLIILMCALVSCVGQKEDPDEPGPSGSGADKAAGLVMDFTATWCVNCPRMTSAIEKVSAQRAIIPICVHFQDDMVCDDGKALVSHFGVQAYPTAVMNMDASTLITATSKDLIIAKLNASASGKEPCDVHISTGADGNVSVTVTAAEAGEYTLSVALLEDGVVAPQTGGSDNYVHNAVFRGFLQENLLGDSLGVISKGSSVERSFSPGSLSGKYRVVAFVCYEGKVNSAKSADLI